MDAWCGGIHEDMLQRPAAGRIILVRHGETEANRGKYFAESDDIPLTPAGRQQARELARRIDSEYRIYAVLSSAFARARETGEIIARELNLANEVIEGIHERDFGCLRGLPYWRLGEMMNEDASYDPQKAWMWAPAGGESLDDVRRRAIAALEPVRERYSDRDVVVVCHGAVIQALCAHLRESWAEPFVPANCAMVLVSHDAQGWGLALTPGDCEPLDVGT